MSRFNTKSMCRIAVLAALYVPLAVFVAIQIGNVRISFGSLPVVVSALLFGPVEAVLVAGIGEFFKQLLTYGVTATTVLYLIPPALRGAYAPVLEERDSETAALVKAADKLSAYIKCLEELKAGNGEFRQAAEQTRAALESYGLPEVQYFMDTFLDSFSLTLDQLK